VNDEVPIRMSAIILRFYTGWANFNLRRNAPFPRTRLMASRAEPES
jgi:hypothetical protein